MFSEILTNKYERHAKIIDTISKRFATYGYERIKTSAFEPYSLYSEIRTSINRNEMIKVIDYTGEVLVLRPDITIPLTKRLANQHASQLKERRYYYVEEVFRQSFVKNEPIGKTQAGIEHYSKGSPEVDAETIMLAYHTLHDIGFSEITLEIGHAGFFAELISGLELTNEQTDRLKHLVQAKNMAEISSFVEHLPIDLPIKKALEQLPLLYGEAEKVLKRLMKIQLSERAKKTIAYLEEVLSVAELYGLKEHIVIDLGLINHMGYYSGVIFQGYVNDFGKPVLMGGRYDSLSEAFGVEELPAIGFACEIESLEKALGDKELTDMYPLDMTVLYEKDQLQHAVYMTSELRHVNYRVLLEPLQDDVKPTQKSTYVITLKKGQNQLIGKQQTVEFSDTEDLMRFIDWQGG